MFGASLVTVLVESQLCLIGLTTDKGKSEEDLSATPGGRASLDPIFASLHDLFYIRYLYVRFI